MTTYTKYKANMILKEVETVEVIRETDANVFLKNGRREAKRTENHIYFDTHKHAVECILTLFQGKINAAKQLANYWEVQLEKFINKYKVQ